MPEEVQLAFQSDYEPVFANVLNQGTIGAFNAMSRATTGISASLKASTRQLWISSSPIDISMQLVFDAHNSAQVDVMEKIEKLSRWVQPTRWGPSLNSPGPSILAPESNKMTVRMGRFLYLTDVILISVSNAIPVLPDQYGKPIAATVEVQMKSSLTMDADDVKEMFNNGGIPGTSGFGPSSPLETGGISSRVDGAIAAQRTALGTFFLKNDVNNFFNGQRPSGEPFGGFGR